MKLKTVLAVALVAAVSFACKEDNEPDPNDNNQNGSSLVMGNETTELTKAVVVNYGVISGAEYNLDLYLHNGSGDTTSDFTHRVYFELNTADTLKIPVGTYNYDANWGANTFDYGDIEVITATDTTYYEATSGKLVVSGSSATSLNCTFNMEVVNENNSSDVMTVTGSYNGSTFSLGMMPVLHERVAGRK